VTRQPLRERLWWHVRTRAERAFLRVVGRRLVCADCGRPMFRALPVVWRGRVRVIGLSEHRVHVSFKDRTSLEFRHVELDRCPAPERPWVR
jgi:hypothetical protein